MTDGNLTNDRGACIVEKGEDMDFFGIVVAGRLRVGQRKQLTEEQAKAGEKIHYIHIGEMLGQQNLAEQSGKFMLQSWKFSIYAELDGIIALIPFGEIKTEVRKHPKAVSNNKSITTL